MRKALITTALLAFSVAASADQVFINAPAQPGQVVDAYAVTAVLYTDRPCNLPIASASQMKYAEVSTSGIKEPRCWSSALGDTVDTVSPSGNRQAFPKSAFVPARTAPGWQFEVLNPEADPLGVPHF
jgi:hypothetical protein